MIHVTLRTRELKNGRKSLYLDFYPPVKTDVGYTRRESLNLYLTGNEPTDTETMQKAESICKARFTAVNSGNYVATPQDLTTALLRYADGKTPSTRRSYVTLYRYMNDYNEHRPLPLSEVTALYIYNFSVWLATQGKDKGNGQLNPNTVAIYLKKLRTFLQHAYTVKLIQDDFTGAVQVPKTHTTEREHLTQEELTQLASTKADERIKTAYLFACLTGLRYSDIKALSVEDYDSNTHSLSIRMKKTGKPLTIYLSDEAISIIERRLSGKEKHLFADLPANNTTNHLLHAWSVDAGINKPLTFHTARHTYATLAISANVDVYTLKELLGHASVQTTQIYAKVVEDRKKGARNAVHL